MSSSDSDQNADSDPALDQAILNHDAARQAYILRNRAVRRIMGVATFVVWLAGNVLMISAGLAFDDIARRITALATVIGSFEMAAMGVISMYWGVGAFDNRSMMGGGGMYGGGMYGSSFGGMASGFSSPGMGGLTARPSGARLTKTPVAAGAAVPPT
jgi:hypothetical protein